MIFILHSRVAFVFFCSFLLTLHFHLNFCCLSKTRISVSVLATYVFLIINTCCLRIWASSNCLLYIIIFEFVYIFEAIYLGNIAGVVVRTHSASPRQKNTQGTCRGDNTIIVTKFYEIFFGAGKIIL